LPDANHSNSTYCVEEPVVYAMTETAPHLSVPDDVRSLTFEEEGLAASFPLPDGVPDALVNKYQLAARRRRELIDAVAVGDAFQAVFAALRDGLDAMRDRLARELALDGAVVEAAQAICDDVLQGTRAHILELIGDADLADTPGK
jgi:hypothetical protein